MLYFNPILNFIYLFIIFIIITALIIFSYKKLAKIITPTYFKILITLKIIAVILLFLIFLRPYIITTHKNLDAFKTTILLDCSNSMKSQCRNSKSRFEILNKIIADSNNFEKFANLKNKEIFMFSNQKHKYFKDSLSLMPGNTAIGDIIQNISETQDTLISGAILLISDGHSNTGGNLIEIAKQCKKKQIPINCIGVGDFQEGKDIAIFVKHTTIKGYKDKNVMLPYVLSNTFNEEKNVSISLFQDNTILDKQTIKIAPNSNQTASFNTISFKAGLQNYRLVVNHLKEDKKPETDIAYVNVNVKEADKFRILYLGNSLNWENKFFKIYASTNEQLEYSSLIRFNKDKLYKSDDLQKKIENIIPEKLEFYNKFDVIILNLNIMPFLNEDTIKNIISFTSNRGGGLLCMGDITNHQNFNKLLPAKQIKQVNFNNNEYLNVKTSNVFPKDSSETLRNIPGLYIPKNSTALIPEKLKLSARALINTKNKDLPILYAHQYGAGRVAHFAIESSWMWHLASKSNKKRYEVFWNKLFVWLGSTGKKRTQILFNATKLPLNQTSTLPIKVYDKFYQPTSDANIKVTITQPNGELINYHFANSADTKGCYNTTFTPRILGEYKASININYKNGESTKKIAYFLAHNNTDEIINNKYQEIILKDISRITNGKFYHYSQLTYPLSLNFSDKIPVITKKFYLCDTWVFIILFIIIIVSEWTIRRKIGLK